MPLESAQTSQSSLCAEQTAKDPRLLYADREDWSDSTFHFVVLRLLLHQLKIIIRPVARQGSLPETRFSFLKHFRILYPFIPNTIQINQRLCNNWHCKDLTQKNSQSLSLILRSCTGIGMVLNKILDKALSSCHNWIKSIEVFAKETEIVK